METAAASGIQKEASLPDLRSASRTASTPEIRVFNQREGTLRQKAASHQGQRWGFWEAEDSTDREESNAHRGSYDPVSMLKFVSEKLPINNSKKGGSFLWINKGTSCLRDPSSGGGSYDFIATRELPTYKILIRRGIYNLEL